MVPILVGMWFAAPSFLPMYWWTKVDLNAIARSSGIPRSQLETLFDLRVRYEPRGEGDPLPWQIINMTPAWVSVYPNAESEEALLVRCTLLSQNDGQPPSTTFINSTYKDRYFKVKGYRLPPGTNGSNAKHPVVIYERMSLETMGITDADSTRTMVKMWESEDLWQDRDDGWEAPVP